MWNYSAFILFEMHFSPYAAKSRNCVSKAQFMYIPAKQRDKIISSTVEKRRSIIPYIYVLSQPDLCGILINVLARSAHKRHASRSDLCVLTYLHYEVSCAQWICVFCTYIRCIHAFCESSILHVSMWLSFARCDWALSVWSAYKPAKLFAEYTIPGEMFAHCQSDRPNSENITRDVHARSLCYAMHA